jgi:branched-chain amino acid transport system ATP-binding protein
MIQRPAILMLDETSEGLSPVIVQQLIEVIKRLQTENITMLAADQSLRFCSRIASRFYVLERGRIQFGGAIEQLWQQVEANRTLLMS